LPRREPGRAKMKPSAALLEAVAVTSELCGRTFSDAAGRMFVADLSGYPEPAVIKALAKCRREVRGILTVQDVVSRIDDGRPGAEEAWAMMPFDEAMSVVWSSEMAEAFGVCGPLLAQGEKVAARMAFKEAYSRLCAAARDAGRPVRWSPSLGHDPRGREAVLAAAVEAGRLTYDHASRICPALPAPARTAIAAEPERVRRMLEGVTR
jgi:hypothetical protein